MKRTISSFCKRGVRPLFLLVCAHCLAASPIQDAYHHLYNFDFDGAHRIVDGYVSAQPNDPLGHATRGAAYLFFELDRLKILQSEFLSDDKKISGKDAIKEKLEPDPKIRDRFYESVANAQRLAEAQLKAHPGDPNSLFSFCITEGMRTDYTALVEKKQLRSLISARRAQSYAVELLQRDPTFVDAYLTTGLNEYLVGSLPFFVRWFVHFDNAQGSKQQGVQNLQKVAADGKYLGPFARILLAIIHLREKQPQEALNLLTGLTRDFPSNPLLRQEFEKLRAKQGKP